MRSSLVLVIWGTFLTFIAPVFAKPANTTTTSTLELVTQLKDTLPQGSEFSLIIEPVDKKIKGKELHYRENYFAAPASTQKLLIALAASLALKKDFTFTTTLSRMNRDLVLKFSGDPTLTRENLKTLFSQKGIFRHRLFRGDLWLDPSIFQGYEKASGWPWDNTGICYSAPASAVTLDKNCIQGAVYADGKPGSVTRVNIPKEQPISVNTSATIITKDEYFKTPCELELTPYSNNSYQLSGCLVQRKKPLPLKFAVQNTAKYVDIIIRQTLKSLGIKWYGKTYLGIPKGKQKVLATHKSAPLPVLIRSMLKYSDNLIADNLLKMLGHYYYKKPGTFKNGIGAEKAILMAHGIDLSNTVMEDASGLSRSNRITARQLAQVLRYIIEHEKRLHLISSLPIAGVDGTLKNRHSVTKPPFKNNLRAKTGSILGSYNLVGTMKDKKGNDYLFVQFISNCHNIKNKKPKPYVTFERLLLNFIY